MKSVVRKKLPSVRFSSNIRLERLKVLAIEHSPSGRVVRAPVGASRACAFVPPSAKVEVLSWPKL